MKSWILGAALIPVIAMPLTPASVNGQEAATAMFNTSYTAYEEYIPYEEEQEEEEMPLVFRTTANLNLRSAPSTEATRITTINNGSLVYVTDLRDGEWFAVEVGGLAGYMYAAFLTEVEDADTIISAINGNVERLHWNDARQVVTTGTTLTVIDVRTGITWQMASFSNGNHADVEPLTAADTAAMLQAWGGRWCWTPRPIHVIVGDRILAASLNGMPHAGSTRANNNMNGHVCMHFYGARTHNGNRRHENDHQNAVNEAFNTAR